MIVESRVFAVVYYDFFNIIFIIVKKILLYFEISHICISFALNKNDDS